MADQNKEPPVEGDPFRRNYGTLTDEQKEDMDGTKMVYEIVWERLRLMRDKYGNSRDLSVTKTHLQESCHWAVRAITKMEGQE